MPEPGDLAAIKTLFEPLHEDPNEKTRKSKRSEHKQLVKKLKRKRMKLKKKNLLVSLMLYSNTIFCICFVMQIMLFIKTFLSLLISG